MKPSYWALTALLLTALFKPNLAAACACGCGVFDVGTGAMMPTDSGGTAYVEYDFMNQTKNWNGSNPSPGANNPDKIVRSNFFVGGLQYMFDRQWGANIEIPYTDRTFKTTPDGLNGGPTQLSQHGDMGDVRIKGIYSGFSDDMSTGLIFGFKLPTGNFTYPGFDRDTAIGTGSTNWILGGYHMGDLSPLTDMPFNWFVNGQWEHAFITQLNYRPGDEFDAAVGAYYNGFDIDKNSKIVPLFQFLGSVREHDIGMNATPSIDGMNQSGYQRLLVSPGIQYNINAFSIYGDVEIPVLQHLNGDQLSEPVLIKLVLSYNF